MSTFEVSVQTMCVTNFTNAIDHEDYNRSVTRHKSALCPHMTLCQVFHNFQPHPALNSDLENERTYFKILTSGILATLLPTEDIMSHCERTLIREILSELIICNMVDKLSEPWMLYEILYKLLDPSAGNKENFDEVTFSQHGLLPSTASDGKQMYQHRRTGSYTSDRSISYKVSSNEIVEVTGPTISKSIGGIIELCLSVFIFLLSVASSILSCLYAYMVNFNDPVLRPSKPVIRSCLVRLFLGIFTVSGSQPWLAANVSLLTSPLSRAPAGGFINFLILSNLRASLSPNLIAQIMSSARNAMFPDGSLGPARPRPTLEEESRVKQNIVHQIHSRIPAIIAKQYFGEDVGKQIEAIANCLEVFSEKEINKHLVLRLLDHVIIKLIPKLEECGVADIYMERGLHDEA